MKNELFLSQKFNAQCNVFFAGGFISLSSRDKERCICQVENPLEPEKLGGCHMSSALQSVGCLVFG